MNETAAEKLARLAEEAKQRHPELAEAPVESVPPATVPPPRLWQDTDKDEEDAP
jgi:hypothetical protein